MEQVCFSFHRCKLSFCFLFFFICLVYDPYTLVRPDPRGWHFFIVQQAWLCQSQLSPTAQYVPHSMLFMFTVIITTRSRWWLECLASGRNWNWPHRKAELGGCQCPALDGMGHGAAWDTANPSFTWRLQQWQWFCLYNCTLKQGTKNITEGVQTRQEKNTAPSSLGGKHPSLKEIPQRRVALDGKLCQREM